MAAIINASNFNIDTIASSAGSTPLNRIAGGVAVRSSDTARYINLAHTTLSRNNCMPSDNPSHCTYQDVAILCLSALSIVAEEVDANAPQKSFFETDKTPQNKADEANEMQRKNYGDNMFPDQDDPFYEMDEASPNYINRDRELSQNNERDLRVITQMATKIGYTNLVTLPRSYKLRQFVEDR